MIVTILMSFVLFDRCQEELTLVRGSCEQLESQHKQLEQQLAELQQRQWQQTASKQFS